ncbi:MAG: hypothetical protein KAI47_07355 [Deltaproteobacteria bacterium]|nr:hypothetical protein [Deltaproteobacteria bacterium]
MRAISWVYDAPSNFKTIGRGVFVLALGMLLGITACSDDAAPPVTDGITSRTDAQSDGSPGEGGPRAEAGVDAPHHDGGLKDTSPQGERAPSPDHGILPDSGPAPGNWVAMTSGVTQDLKGIWAASATDIWAVGASGTILHYDGKAWTAQKSGVTVDLQAIHGSSATSLWAVGASGTVLHYDGTTWRNEKPPTVEDLYDVWATGTGDVWTVGDAGAVLHRGANTWIYSPSATGLTLYGVWAANANDVWAVGAGATVIRHNHLKWTKVPVSVGGYALHAIWGLSPSQIWIGGKAGASAFFNGKTWLAMPLAPTGNLFGIWGRSSHDVWATGGKTVSVGPFEGALFHTTGGPWSAPFTPSTKAFLEDLWGVGAQGPWAVGAQGTILRWQK